MQAYFLICLNMLFQRVIRSKPSKPGNGNMESKQKSKQK